MFLFFDIETAGRPRSWKAPATDVFNWPRLVEIAWQLYDKKVQLIESNQFIIRPEGFEITYDSERIHGISMEKAKEEGVPVKEALEAFAKVVDSSDTKFSVAHNMNLGENVLGAEFYRKSMNLRLHSTEQICVMQEGTYFCKLPGTRGRYKWPSLQQLYAKIFGAGYIRENGAMDDVQAVANCFFKLVEKEEIDIF